MVLPAHVYRKMKLKINLPESPEVVYYLVKSLGLAPITMKNRRFHPPSLLSKLYPVLVSVSYLVFGLLTLFIVRKHASKLAQSVVLWNAITRVMNVLSVTLAPIIFLSMYDKIVYLVNKLCIIGNELKRLGIKEKRGQFFKDLFVTTVMANAALIAACLVVYLLEPNWHYITSMKYSIESWFNLNTVLIFVQLLVCIRQRFVLLNEKLYNLLAPAGDEGSLHEVQIFVVSRNSRENNEPGSEGLTDLQRFRKIKTLHLELCDLVDRTAHIFAIPILLHAIRSSIQCIFSMYWMYFILQDPIEFQNQRYAILCTVLRIVIMNVLFFIIADASAMTCEQGNLTRGVLCKTWMKFRPAKLADEFVYFSNQLLQTPITVSAFGLVDLGYSFVYKILSIMISYLVVMIQFGPQLK